MDRVGRQADVGKPQQAPPGVLRQFIRRGEGSDLFSVLAGLALKKISGQRMAIVSLDFKNMKEFAHRAFFWANGHTI